MLKVILFLSLFFSSSIAFAENFKQFDIVEIKALERKPANNISELKEGSEKKQKHLKKGESIRKKYGIILSGTEYNTSAKNVIIAPVTLNEKKYKGRYIFTFKNGASNYAIFVDKIRTIQQSGIIKSDLTLQEKEKLKVKELFNDLSK